MSDASKREEKQKWAIEKPKLDNARRLRGIHFHLKNARRKLEIPMPAAMPCKTSFCRSSRDTCRTTGEHKKNTHVLLKLTNLQESVRKELLIKAMKIILQ